MSMQTRECTARFLAPAFLGNAAQDGQWRSPPFKHLLRAWWRVAWAEANGFSGSVDTLRRDEGALFGSAADGTGHRSRVRLRLDRWNQGSLKRWQPLGAVQHPEVRVAVDAGLYLGYGPVRLPRGSREPALKGNAAIQAGESARLRLAFPDGDSRLIDRALALMDAFGTLGGRSRNGWGSLALEGAPALGSLPLRDWEACLDRDWPHAIGRDERGALVWQTEPFDDWQGLMRRLAEIKIGFRTRFPFPKERPPHQRVEDRHWLAYPVTRHVTRSWNRNARLPNSLRFKVIAVDGGLRGRIFHVPCLPPPQFRPDRHAIERVWREVHAFLDGTKGVERTAP